MTTLAQATEGRVSHAFHISMGEAEAAIADLKMGSGYGFLTDAFKPKYFMSESLDMLRKLALVLSSTSPAI